MWVVTTLILCAVGLPCMTLEGPSQDAFVGVAPVFEQPPASTREACHVAAVDALNEYFRRNGQNAAFDVGCEKVAV